VIGVQTGPLRRRGSTRLPDQSGADSGMLIVETIAKIRRAYFVQGKPIKAISRELRVSRKVIRKVLRTGATQFEYERSVQPRPKIGPWQEELDSLLSANEGKPARERLTLIRVFEELRGRGYAGGYRRPSRAIGCKPNNPCRPRPWVDYQVHRGKEELAKRRALFFRATFIPTLASALDEGRGVNGRQTFADRLERGLTSRIADSPIAIDIPAATMVLRKTTA
jgi:hypothetical protein